MTNNSDGWRTQPMYSFTESAHLAGVSAGTVRNWLFGYTGKRRGIKPLFSSHEGQGPMVSFLQLIEIVVAVQFRKAERVSFARVKNAYENAQRKYDLEYPFAFLELEALGGHIIQRIRHERPGTSTQTLDQPEQWTIPDLVLDTIHQIDYERDLAARWYPVGKEQHIVVDPRISAGIPTITGRGVTVQAIRKRWKTGQRISFIAQDFDLESDVVETVLQYAERVAA